MVVRDIWQSAATWGIEKAHLVSVIADRSHFP
jgi:hypothetical protein